MSIEEKGHATVRENRRYFETLRNLLDLYEDVVRRCSREGRILQGKDFGRLRDLAGKAIDELGSQGQPCPISLKNYDHESYGPFLGVSDEGSAASKIREAALSSPKICAVGHADPIVVGVSHDAERLGAVGEVVVGPEEYREIRLECIGRILTSTNVGTRLNLRYYKRRPVIDIPLRTLAKSVASAKRQARAVLEPFWRTPDGIPRPITVFAQFIGRSSFKHRLEVLRALVDTFTEGDICDPSCHKLGLLVYVGRGKKGLQKAMNAIDLASNAGLAEVAIKGTVLGSAEDMISMPGLLNYFNPAHASELLSYAARKRMPISPRNTVDPDTVARSVWNGLCTARNMGLELGKYGLFPLTLTESDQVMGKIQNWFSSWTAAPAFYVDLPTVDSTTVYAEANIEEGIERWLRITAKHRIPVVLIDTVDKDKGRRLLKNSPADSVGILLLNQIARINRHANKLGVKILWAGGITVQQAFEMGKLGVFGVYVTSAAAISKPVSGEYERDVMLTREKEPTFHGVYRIKVLLEAGFLVSRLKEYGLDEDADCLSRKVNLYLKAFRKYEYAKMKKEQTVLVLLTTKAWKAYFRRLSLGTNDLGPMS
jgi:hypothetical protein